MINIGFTLNGSNLGGKLDTRPNGTSPIGVVGSGTTTVTYGNTWQCSNLYCHSSGQSANGQSATPVYASPNPTWNNSGNGACGTCHLTGAISTGSHAQHLSSTVTIQCGDCHTGAGNGMTVPTANHVNKSIDLASSLSYTMGGAPGNGYGRCNIASCHGSGTPTWGTSYAGGTDVCTKCHGTPSASPATNAQKAPPKDTAGNSTGSKVGAHQSHLASTIGRTLAVTNVTLCRRL